MKIRPMNDRVLVARENEAETTASGIIIPDTAKEKPQKGTVVAVGPGKVAKNGDRITLEVSVGDRVLFSKYGGTEIDVEGVEHLVLKEEDILGILE